MKCFICGNNVVRQDGRITTIELLARTGQEHCAPVHQTCLNDALEGMTWYGDDSAEELELEASKVADLC